MSVLSVLAGWGDFECLVLLMTMVIVIVGADRTLRILENKPSSAAELACLPHTTQIASACWMEGFSAPAVLTLCMDGSVTAWTRTLVSVLCCASNAL